MNKLLLAGGAVGLAMTGLVAAGSVSAMANGNGGGNGNQGGQGYGLTTQSKVLDMDRDQLRTQLQDKTMLQVAEDQGLTQEQFQARVRAAQTERWQAAGLSSDQITERQQNMDERQANCDGTPGDMHRYGREQ